MRKEHSPFEKELTRRGFLGRIAGFCASHWLLSGLALGGTGTFTYAEHETVTLKQTNLDLYYPELPEALNGKTLCQLSDLHLESLQIKPEAIAQMVNQNKPDLLVLTGDLISERKDLDKVTDYLKPLEAKFGKYIVMGNNDYSHFSRTLFKHYLELMRELNWVPLLNEAEFMPNLNLWVIGIDDPATAHDDVPKAYEALKQSLTKGTAKAPFRLALAHSTDCLDDVAEYGADLLLTGHTHGGQIRLPGMGPLITNTYLGDHGIYAGYHVINNVPLYINTGIGESVLPLRFNVPPEIAFFTLHKGYK